MATTTSVQLSIAAGLAPSSVVIGVHGELEVTTVAGLQRVLDAILEDKDILAVHVSLRHVHGIDIGAISGLSAAAERAEQRGVELTLDDPPERLCQALEEEGLTGLIRMALQDRRPPWVATEVDRRQARRRHPSNQPRAVEGTDGGKAAPLPTVAGWPPCAVEETTPATGRTEDVR